MAKSADAFRTISEVAEWLDTPAHVLRFWESRFTQVKPVKRAGGRRYYRPNDMLLLGGIKKLLHEDGMTIKGAQKLLRTDGVKKVSALSQPLDSQDSVTIDLKPVDTVVEATIEPSPPLGIVASEQSETVPEATTVVALDPEPEDAPDPEPVAAPDPEPDAAPISEPAPLVDAELEPTQPEVDIPPSVPVAETFETPSTDIAAQSTEPDTATADDVGEQLSSIYSRLSALHDRMKASIDPKRQG